MPEIPERNPLRDFQVLEILHEIPGAIEDSPDDWPPQRRERIGEDEIIFEFEAGRHRQGGKEETEGDWKYIERVVEVGESLFQRRAEAIRRIDYQARKEGIEALAWYRPFHYSPHENWGIYIKLDGMLLICKYLVRNVGLPVGEAFGLAGEVLRRHEMFHGNVERGTTYVELLSGRASYIPYQKGVYAKEWPETLEEALANLHAYNTNLHVSDIFKSPVSDELKRFFKSQPGAYGKFDHYIGSMVRERKLLFQKIVGSFVSVDFPFHYEIPRRTPIYIVMPRECAPVHPPPYLAFVKDPQIARNPQKEGARAPEAEGVAPHLPSSRRQPGSHPNPRGGNRVW